MYLPSGITNVSTGQLVNVVTNTYLKQALFTKGEYSIHYRHRHFFKKNINLDYLPSPYLLSFCLKVKTPSNLAIQTPRFHYTALHVFGKDIYDHPGEGPFRFRIIVGADYYI